MTSLLKADDVFSESRVASAELERDPVLDTVWLIEGETASEAKRLKSIWKIFLEMSVGKGLS